jgi:carbonic anhydrase/acetyltransferase-like protein (isoleucine patch superfamily)
MTEKIIRPRLGPNVYIAPSAYVGGDVTFGADCTVMHHVVIRGDISPITIGRRVNIQDGTIIHTRRDVPLEIGDDVSIGHRAVVHCRRIGPGSLIGIGAIVLDDAEIGAGSIVAAGALVPPGTVIAAGKLVVGLPARVLRDVSAADRSYLEHVVSSYLELGRAYAAGRFPNHAG